VTFSKKLSPFLQNLSKTIVALILFTISFSIYVFSEKQIDRANEIRLVSFMLADELRHSSDDLTRMVRTYIVTENPAYKEHYQEILDIRNGLKPRPINYQNIYWDLVGLDNKRPRPYSNQTLPLIEIMRQAGFTPPELDKLTEAKKNSDGLTQTEFAAMKLIESKDLPAQMHRQKQKALELLHDETYHNAKASIMRPIDAFYILMNERTNIAVERAQVIAFYFRILFISMGGYLFYTLWQILVADKARQKIEEALQKSQKHLATIIENEPECVKLVDARGKLLEMNPAGLAMLEALSLEEAQKFTLIDYLLPPWRSRFIDLHKRVMNGENGILEFEIQGLQGTHRWLETHATPLRDGNGNVTMLLGITRDTTERKNNEEKIRYLANFDSLTGLPNRTQLDLQIKNLLSLAKRNQKEITVMFLDLDRFKEINDTLGHSIGDQLLIQSSVRLQSLLREEDMVARLGGDEFIILLPNIQMNGAAQVAQKLLGILGTPFQIEEHELNISASIGIALYPNDGIDFETLYKNADTAMYRAKQEGRNGYCFFTNEMQEHSVRNLELSNALRHALEKNQLQLYYQPQISSKNGEIIGAEALIRWIHPEYGTVSPCEFIPILEENGLILPIGEWILRTAVSQAKHWMEQGYKPIIISVNLSAVQFRHLNLLNTVATILEEIGLSPQYLELELTESVAMRDPKKAINIMNNLHNLGVRMSIDDFGTGYSSLSYLKKFKIYKLKIDQSFVRDISTDNEDKAIVSAIISMAKLLGYQTIAEGVETVEQLEYLTSQGCDEIQGYFYSKPLSIEDFEMFRTIKKR